MSALGRRGFVKLAAGVCVAAALPGCASVAVTRVTPSGGTIRLALRDNPRLALPGGYLRVLPVGAPTPMYVLALDDGGFAALLPVCTHLGCIVNVEGAWLVCPCHGSTYERTGDVVRGPAERPLGRYPIELTEDGDLIIRMETPS